VIIKFKYNYWNAGFISMNKNIFKNLSRYFILFTSLVTLASHGFGTKETLLRPCDQVTIDTTKRFSTVRMSPDGRFLVVNYNSKFRLQNLQTGKFIWERPLCHVLESKFSPNCTCLGVLQKLEENLQTLLIVDPEIDDFEPAIRTSIPSVLSFKFSQDSKLVTVKLKNKENTIQVINLKKISNQEKDALWSIDNASNSYEFSPINLEKPEESYIAIKDNGHTLHMLDTHNGGEIWKLNNVSSFAFSSNNNGKIYIAVRFIDNRLQVFDAETSNLHPEWEKPIEHIDSFKFSPRGSFLMAIQQVEQEDKTKKRLYFFNITTREKVLWENPIQPSSIKDFIVSPDEKHVALKSKYNILRLFNFETGILQWEATYNHFIRLNDVMFNPDSKLIAVPVDAQQYTTLYIYKTKINEKPQIECLNTKEKSIENKAILTISKMKDVIFSTNDRGETKLFVASLGSQSNCININVYLLEPQGKWFLEDKKERLKFLDHGIMYQEDKDDDGDNEKEEDNAIIDDNSRFSIILFHKKIHTTKTFLFL